MRAVEPAPGSLSGVLHEVCHARMQAAVDVDILAVHATKSNAELNSCGDRCHVCHAEPFASGPEPLVASGAPDEPDGYDIALANILKPALLDLRQRIVGYVKPGGAVVLSGLLEHQVRPDSAELWHATSMLVFGRFKRKLQQ